jgi:hypothetical protein
VLQIHDILVWIRIRGSMPLTNESGSCPFCHFDSQDANKKLIFLKLLITFWMYIYSHDFSKIKSQKEVKKQKESRLFLLLLLDERRIRYLVVTNGSISGSRRPKNIWIRRIRILIRNTPCHIMVHKRDLLIY